MSERKYSPIENDAERPHLRLARTEPQNDEHGGPDGDATVAWLPDPPPLYRAIKRSIDIVFSAFALVLMAPVFLAIAIAIKLTSNGPVLFRQTRLGRRGRRFTLFKFRTMYMAHDERRQKEFVGDLIAEKFGPPGEGTAHKIRADYRITRVGKFLRRYSLDEFPQFLNVLRGDMSLVGPRPPIPYELLAYQPWHRQRLSGKPGITGLWQVSGEPDLSFDEMVQSDIEYIEHPSVMRDLKILLIDTLMSVTRDNKPF